MHKKLMAAVSLLLMSSFAVAAEAEVLRDIVYGHKDGMALVMDIYQPEGPANGAGVAEIISGGFVSTLEMQGYHEPIITQFLDAGFTIFAVRHGSSPRYKVPDAYRDVTQAIEFIGAHAQEYGVDPRRVGVFGASAGGILALLASLAETTLDGEARRFRPAAVVAYRVLVGEMPPPTPDQSSAVDYERLPGLDAKLSPLNHVSPNDPPVLLVHGDADELAPVTESERMHAALREAGVETKLVVLEGVAHESFRDMGADAEMLEWFQKYLK